MALLFLVLFSLLIILITNIARMFFRNNFVSVILTLLFLILATSLVKYTPDWWGYEYWIAEGTGKDLFFNFFANKLLPSGQGYQFMHISFTIMYAIMLVYLVSRFTEHTFIVCLLYLISIYLFYTTQIRFFMGYFAFFIGLYFWQVQKRYLWSVIMILFALANHSSMFIFLLLLPLFVLNIERLLFRVVQILIIVSVLYFVFRTIISLIPEEYYLVLYFLEADHHSTFLGGVFTFLPTIITLLILHFYAMRKVDEYPELLDDLYFQFLYRFTVIPLLFFGIATERQVLGHRFILPSMLFQLLLIMYLGYYNTPKQNSGLRWMVIFIVPFFVFYTYFLSEMLVDSELTNTVMKVIDSNPVLNSLY